MGNLVSKSSRGGIVFVYRQIGYGRVGNPAQVRQGIDPANPRHYHRYGSPSFLEQIPVNFTHSQRA
jgi:hypothetical protein